MNRTIISCALCAIFLITGCLVADEIKTGSMISRDGVITDRSTSYAFNGIRTGNNIKRVFADIYFKGDMLCFSTDDMRNISLETVDVTFFHPPSGHMLKAERLEKNGSCIWGFSLVGSLLEAFFPDELELPASGKSFRNIDIPVVIDMKYKSGDKNFSRKKSLSFHVSY